MILNVSLSGDNPVNRHRAAHLQHANTNTHIDLHILFPHRVLDPARRTDKKARLLGASSLVLLSPVK
ncbi:rfaE bifunctional protein [Anopheles sinensis]|uniref:RfaE bifunctional protein n=1 Tax=Anopheles sinensis TaxID=74873 RepID=A0A084W0P7_ANOSI|nr:rfaE bifunctional protein [Anopheles sinensis]